MALLETRSIAKRYDGVAALIDASVALHAGEVHALMGENGAGKSTLARIIAGAEVADSGELLLDGEPYRPAGPRDAQARGIAIIYQELDLFPHLTVGENIVIGNLRFAERMFSDRNQIAAFSAPFLKRVGLNVEPGQPVADLPIGHQQLIAIARALSMECRVLLMDEPSSALADDAAERLFTVIADLKRSGVAIGYVSHKMDEIFRLSDRITVMRDGQTIDTRPIAAIDRETVIRMMVGRPLDLSQRSDRDADGDVLLSVDKLSTAVLESVSFTVRRGEVLGVAGLVGAGRSELGAALVGLDASTAGSMRVAGRPFAPTNPADAQLQGVVLLPEDRKLQGLMLAMSVAENGALAILSKLGRSGLIDRRSERAALRPMAQKLGIKAASPDLAVGALSGGNQQKALLARWLLAEPELIFLDDPARGIDVGAKEDIYAIIDGLAASGKAVIMASSELPELLRCCDRIMVLREGKVTAIMDAATATQEKIMAAATQELEPA